LSFTQGKARLRCAPAGLALGWILAAPLGRKSAALRAGKAGLGAAPRCASPRRRPANTLDTWGNYA